MHHETNLVAELAVDRRDWLRWIASAGATVAGVTGWGVTRSESAGAAELPAGLDLRDRVAGMLVGSALGDAAGGPVEFQNPADLPEWLPNTRAWPEDLSLQDPATCDRLAGYFRLLPYDRLRPEPAPYAHWSENAAIGSVTDDTRWKICLIDALRLARQAGRKSPTENDLARAIVGFAGRPEIQKNEGWAAMCEEGFREFRLASNWILGSRDPQHALPPARIWGGLGTVCGQMILPPLAALFPGQPSAAYQAAYDIAFFDNAAGRDINAAIIGGLAQALAEPISEKTPRRDAYHRIWNSMKQTDPYRYGDIPWVPRALSYWVNFAIEAADRSAGVPQKLFEILENEAQPKQWWDAHFIMVCAISMIELAQHQPLAALELALDFGHDTDSAAQLIGAFCGAIEGQAYFDPDMTERVVAQFETDYDERFSQWTELLISHL